jgi:ubiquitin-conjugating enzyme E2 H
MSQSSAVRAKRILRDVAALKKSGFKVTTEDGRDDLGDHPPNEFRVILEGPKDSPYEGYAYAVGFSITESFPFKSPSVGFRTRIYHPNVDEASGTICLDSLNKTWSPAFSLENVMQQLTFLLQYPNPADPFNREAASLMLQNEAHFKDHAKSHASKYGIKLT